MLMEAQQRRVGRGAAQPHAHGAARPRQRGGPVGASPSPGDAPSGTSDACGSLLRGLIWLKKFLAPPEPTAVAF